MLDFAIFYDKDRVFMKALTVVNIFGCYIPDFSLKRMRIEGDTGRLRTIFRPTEALRLKKFYIFHTIIYY